LYDEWNDFVLAELHRVSYLMHQEEDYYPSASYVRISRFLMLISHYEFLMLRSLSMFSDFALFILCFLIYVF